MFISVGLRLLEMHRLNYAESDQVSAPNEKLLMGRCPHNKQSQPDSRNYTLERPCFLIRKTAVQPLRLADLEITEQP